MTFREPAVLAITPNQSREPAASLNAAGEFPLSDFDRSDPALRT